MFLALTLQIATRYPCHFTLESAVVQNDHIHYNLLICFWILYMPQASYHNHKDKTPLGMPWGQVVRAFWWKLWFTFKMNKELLKCEFRDVTWDHTFDVYFIKNTSSPNILFLWHLVFIIWRHHVDSNNIGNGRGNKISSNLYKATRVQRESHVKSKWHLLKSTTRNLKWLALTQHTFPSEIFYFKTSKVQEDISKIFLINLFTFPVPANRLLHESTVILKNIKPTVFSG